jgi:hypothetical protein
MKSSNQVPLPGVGADGWIASSGIALRCGRHTAKTFGFSSELTLRIDADFSGRKLLCGKMHRLSFPPLNRAVDKRDAHDAKFFRRSVLLSDTPSDAIAEVAGGRNGHAEVAKLFDF